MIVALVDALSALVPYFLVLLLKSCDIIICHGEVKFVTISGEVVSWDALLLSQLFHPPFLAGQRNGYVDQSDDHIGDDDNWTKRAKSKHGEAVKVCQ